MNTNNTQDRTEQTNEEYKKFMESTGKVECECGRAWIDPKKFSQCWECYIGR